jgi:hypothetical protein
VNPRKTKVTSKKRDEFHVPFRAERSSISPSKPCRIVQELKKASTGLGVNWPTRQTGRSMGALTAMHSRIPTKQRRSQLKRDGTFISAG